MKVEPSRPKRVCIVGGGVAGMSCAYSLGRFPERFDVEVWEALPVPGGVASSCDINTENGEKFQINDQVQGGAPSYRNNILFFEKFGFSPHKVDFKVCFGTGDTLWSNHKETKLVERLRPEIARFGKVLEWVRFLEPLTVFLPIASLLRWLGFSAEFRNLMVFPLTALFFGTGNQTPHVSAAVIGRVFLDDDLKLFEYCPKRLLNACPEMFAFSRLESIFESMRESLGPKVKVYTDRKVTKVERGLRGEEGSVRVSTAGGHVGRFDEVVFACDAETILKVLEQPRWIERRALGNVRYYNDCIVTHEDEDYMKERYHLIGSDDDMYFVRTDPTDRELIEMSFNLSAYQPHLSDAHGRKKRVFQSIFLDDSGKDKWTVDAIDKSKILKTRWTRQFAHTWTHFAFWVPFVRFLQGHRSTWYCGAYTLFNTHEIGTMSGLAVADRLGAPYPFAHDALALKQFEQFMSIVHGCKRSKPAPGTEKQASANNGKEKKGQ